jgi:hypothetical protein
LLPSEILKHIETIITSVLTAAGTTFLIIYIKNRKMRLIEQITVYDDRIRIIDSIVMNSIF